MGVKIISFFINILKYIFVPLFMPFRNQARVYVYSHMLNNNIKTFLLKPVVLNGENYVDKDANIFLKKIKTKKIIYYIYFYIIWIWYDDNTVDGINIKTMINVLKNNKLLKNRLTKDLTIIVNTRESTNFNCCVIKNFDINNYTLLLLCSMLYTSNNYVNFKKYRSKQNKGDKLSFINGTAVYSTPN